MNYEFQIFILPFLFASWMIMLLFGKNEFQIFNPI